MCFKNGAPTNKAPVVFAPSRRDATDAAIDAGDVIEADPSHPVRRDNGLLLRHRLLGQRGRSEEQLGEQTRQPEAGDAQLAGSGTASFFSFIIALTCIFDLRQSDSQVTMSLQEAGRREFDCSLNDFTLK